MTTKKPETPEEQWKAIVAFAHGRDAVEEEEAESAAEVEASLRTAGVDVDRLNRDRDAFVQAMHAELDAAQGEIPAPPISGPRAAVAEDPHVASAEQPSNVVPIASRSRRARYTTLLLIAAVGLFAVIGTVATIATREPPPPPPIPLLPTPEATPQELAVAERAAAQKACDKGDFDECRRQLQEARKRDPAGEDLPEVRVMRKQILDAFGLKKGPSEGELKMPQKPPGTGR